MSYAVIKTGGKQYRVAEGDKLDVEKIDGEIGETATFDQVLAVSNGDSLTVGAPTVDGASVTAEVIDQFKAKKVTAFKFKRRKGFHKTKGHRQRKTRVEIKSISA